MLIMMGILISQNSINFALRKIIKLISRKFRSSKGKNSEQRAVSYRSGIEKFKRDYSDDDIISNSLASFKKKMGNNYIQR